MKIGNEVANQVLTSWRFGPGGTLFLRRRSSTKSWPTVTAQVVTTATIIAVTASVGAPKR